MHTADWIAGQHKRHYADLIARLPALIGRLAWDRAAIEAEQLARLRAMVAHAQAHSAWHRARLAHIDAASMTLTDVSRIPPMTKTDLMANWDAICTVDGANLADAQAFAETLGRDDYYRETNHVVSSGGSSGLTGVVIYDWDGFADHYASVCRGHVPLLMRVAPPGELRMASVGADSAKHISFACTDAFATPGNPTLRAPSTLPLATIVERLNAQAPQFLHGYPSMFAVLAREAEAGRLRITPDIVYSSSEPLGDDLAARLRALWPGILLDCWSTTETTGSFPCTGDAAFHIAEDMNIVEIVPGDAGGVLVTNLYNRALPLIRFAIDDRFELMDGPCSCGTAFQAVRAVAGRVNRMFDYPGGVSVSTVVFETRIVATPGIANWQVRQTGDGAEVLVESVGGIDLPDLEARLTAALADGGLARASVTVRAVDHIARTRGGKIRRFLELADAAGAV